MHKVVFIRHGESIWNNENLFTGWVDVGLSEKGKQEAMSAGRILREHGFIFDIAFTSMLKRAIDTTDIVLKELGLSSIPTEQGWQLNERHYGALQGLNKKEVRAKIGDKQYQIWRRSFDTAPPSVKKTSGFYPGNDPAYDKLQEKNWPCSECLKDTLSRVLPYWQEKIAPVVKQGKKVLVSSHGSTMRALVKHFESISDKDVEELNIPTGIPMVYEFDENLKPIKYYYLGDKQEIEKATQHVANQGRN